MAPKEKGEPQSIIYQSVIVDNSAFLTHAKPASGSPGAPATSSRAAASKSEVVVPLEELETGRF